MCVLFTVLCYCFCNWSSGCWLGTLKYNNWIELLFVFVDVTAELQRYLTTQVRIYQSFGGEIWRRRDYYKYPSNQHERNSGHKHVRLSNAQSSTYRWYITHTHTNFIFFILKIFYHEKCRLEIKTRCDTKKKREGIKITTN